jgi:hypothetical protein
MNMPLFLFCGGPAIDGTVRPKPLMQVRVDRSLIVHFLYYLERHRPVMPSSITLLCDEGQETAISAELHDLPYPVPIRVHACGAQASTFEKFEKALHAIVDNSAFVQFGYPDIFFFGEYVVPKKTDLESNVSVHISAAALTSRFPRLIVDVYNNKIIGISNYNSPVPANPLHVFGGDLWGRVDQLLVLIGEYRAQVSILAPSFEYDFFFWLINHKKMRCVMLYGEQLRVDSMRDVQRLLERTRGVL